MSISKTSKEYPCLGRDNEAKKNNQACIVLPTGTSFYLKDQRCRGLIFGLPTVFPDISNLNTSTKFDYT
jgi:hypothetical protein